MKKLLLCLMSVLFIFAAGCAENYERYNLSDINLGGVTVEHYEYSYIEFDFDKGIYRLENKTKSNGIVTKQSGSFTTGLNEHITVTNDDIPSQNYLLYIGEELYFKGSNFYVEAYIDGIGYCSLIFTK